MEIRLLGAVEAQVDGSCIPLGSPGQRFLLAVLALEANRVVPLERLIALRWPESAPPTATHAVRVAVSRLRAVLQRVEAARFQVNLATMRPGYLLQVDPMKVDVHRFRDLVCQAHQADDQHRIALLQEALGLWRGPALAGAGPHSSADALAAGLEEARLLALEDEMEAYLRTGRHREVLDQLTDLVKTHPMRERPIGQLMLALHRSGRTHEALQTFHRARRHRAESYGLEPSAELRGVEMAILRDDPALSATAQSAPTALAVATAQLHPHPHGDGEPCALARSITDRLPSADPATVQVVTKLLGVADALLT